MLGEQILEETGKARGVRVLSSFPANVTLETSLDASGTLLGIEHTCIWTYTATVRPDGLVQGEGRAVYTTKDGDVATVLGTGVGKPGRGLAASWRGSFYFFSDAEKLARLNGVAVVFEYEFDEEGNSIGKAWEWK